MHLCTLSHVFSTHSYKLEATYSHPHFLQWDSEMLNNFPKVIQLLIRDGGIQNQALFPFPEHGALWCNWQ